MNTAEPTPLEAVMLQHVYRFGMGLADLGVFLTAAQHRRHDATALLDALAHKGYLGQALLFGNINYYYLAERTHEEFDCLEKNIGPLSELEKVKRYAMLRFCLTQATRAPAMFRASFEKHCPDLFYATSRPPHRCRDYYYTQSRLGYLRVDCATGGVYRRVLEKVRRHIGTLNRLPPYAELLGRDALEFCIVTAFPTKADRLRQDVSQRQPDAPIIVHVIPELRELLAPPRIMPASS